VNISIELTAILLMAVGGVFWLAGLSFSNNRNTEDIKDLKRQHEKDVDILHLKHSSLADELRDALGDMKTSLARIEERLFRD